MTTPVFQGMVTGQRILAQTGLDGILLTNVMNACRSVAVAIREAALAIRAGEHHVMGRFRGPSRPTRATSRPRRASDARPSTGPGGGG
jgi:acetyl-CoA acetyltransferase